MIPLFKLVSEFFGVLFCPILSVPQALSCYTLKHMEIQALKIVNDPQPRNAASFNKVRHVFHAVNVGVHT